MNNTVWCYGRDMPFFDCICVCVYVCVWVYVCMCVLSVSIPDSPVPCLLHLWPQSAYTRCCMTTNIGTEQSN